MFSDFFFGVVFFSRTLAMAELSLRRSKKVTQVPLVSSASIAATSDRSHNTAKNADEDDNYATNKDDNHSNVPETEVIGNNYNQKKLSIPIAEKGTIWRTSLNCVIFFFCTLYMQRRATA